MIDSLQKRKYRSVKVRKIKDELKYTFVFDNLVIKTDLLTYFSISEDSEEKSNEFLKIKDFLYKLHERINNPIYHFWITSVFLETDSTIVFNFQKDDEMDNLIFDDHSPYELDGDFDGFIYIYHLKELKMLVDDLISCV